MKDIKIYWPSLANRIAKLHPSQALVLIHTLKEASILDQNFQQACCLRDIEHSYAREVFPDHHMSRMLEVASTGPGLKARRTKAQKKPRAKR